MKQAPRIRFSCLGWLTATDGIVCLVVEGKQEVARFEGPDALNQASALADLLNG